MLVADQFFDALKIFFGLTFAIAKIKITTAMIISQYHQYLKDNKPKASIWRQDARMFVRWRPLFVPRSEQFSSNKARAN